MSTQRDILRRPIPVTILAGYLGAGKTTLLRRLLQDARGVRYGVLVNDFAAINIDAAMISDVGPDRIALSNGCVCCTIRDDMLAAAFALIGGDVGAAPEHILIECSGVSDPRSVAIALTGELARAAFRVDAIITLVDAANVMDMDFDTTEQVIDQAAASDLVLINKCDIAPAEQVDAVERLLREAQPTMRCIRTNHAAIPAGLVAAVKTVERLWSNGDGKKPAHAHTTHFASHSWQTDRPLALADFKIALHTLHESVYRAKGILRFAEHPGYRALFQLVGKRSDLTFEPEVDVDVSSSLVAIGRTDPMDPRAFDAVFQPVAKSSRPKPQPSTEPSVGGVT